MKYLIVLISLLLVTPVVAQTSPPSETVCYTKTATQFMLDNASLISGKVHVVDGPELEKFMEKVNLYRAQAGGNTWGADTMLIAILVDGSIGMVLFQDGCMVKDSAYNTDVETMTKIFKEYDSLDVLKRLKLIKGTDA